MSQPTAQVLDLSAFARSPEARDPGRIGHMAGGLIGSEILKIASDIRALVREGRKICNLTVGDFDPKQFPIPAQLRRGIETALERGETNYPPSDGVLELRQAVRGFYARELGLGYPLESFLIAGGARPVIYGTYRTLIDPGDKVVYPIPSWNNNHYVHMTGAVGVPVECRREHAFLPTRDDIAGAISGARLVSINSPLNPTGTAFDRETLAGICALILEENRARARRGERPVYLMYDHIYWMLCVEDTEHVTPPEIEPEMARYTIFVDGISKAFAATGVRVGWAVGPVDVIERMSAVLGHVGAWAPRAEQVATVGLLEDASGMHAYLAEFRRGVNARLARLHQGLTALRVRGLPVDSLEPMGAIYLTACFHPFGRTTPSGQTLRTSEDVRRYVLDAAGVAIVPFSAFGATRDEGWFRLSVGAVSLEAIDAALPRLADALGALR